MLGLDAAGYYCPVGFYNFHIDVHCVHQYSQYSGFTQNGPGLIHAERTSLLALKKSTIYTLVSPLIHKSDLIDS